jgi:hypothetical protein
MPYCAPIACTSRSVRSILGVPLLRDRVPIGVIVLWLSFVIIDKVTPYKLWEANPSVGRIPPQRTDTGCFLIAEVFGARAAFIHVVYSPLM